MDYPLRSLPDLVPADLPQLEVSRTGHYHHLAYRACGLYGINGAVTFAL
jgi:hypothetical protein